MRRRQPGSVLVVLAAGVVVTSLTGCGLIPHQTGGFNQPSSSPTPSPSPTYNSDATGEVVGTNCRYDQNSQQFKYDVSIQNPSSDFTFRYTFTIEFTGGDSAFADDSFGTRPENVTVGRNNDRKLTISQGYNMTKETYYGCNVSRPSKVAVGG